MVRVPSFEKFPDMLTPFLNVKLLGFRGAFNLNTGLFSASSSMPFLLKTK